MLALEESHLKKRIVGCGDGPASFNQEVTARGGTVVSVDPIYRFTAAQIRERIDATYENVIEQTRRNQEKSVWTTVGSVEELGRMRLASMQRFLEGYEAGLEAGRYVAAKLPQLPRRPLYDRPIERGLRRTGRWMSRVETAVEESMAGSLLAPASVERGASEPRRSCRFDAADQRDHQVGRPRRNVRAFR